MNEEELKKKCDDFAHDLQLIQDKHNVSAIVCHNWDDDSMGYTQLHKMINDVEEPNRYTFVVAFSGTNNTICPCCKAREANEKGP